MLVIFFVLPQVGSDGDQMALQFDGVPASVAAGQAFTFAVLLEGADEGDDGQRVTVRAGAGTPAAALGPDGAWTAELGCGEALFSDVAFAPDAGGEVTLVATCEAAGGGLSATTTVRVTAAGSDDVDDVVTLTEQLAAEGTGPKAKLLLSMLKARMWSREGNGDRLATCGALAAVTAALAGATTDVAIECITVVEELLRNPAGAVIPSCAACKALLRDGGLRVVETGHAFHAGCLGCAACREGLPAGEAFVKDAGFKPFHMRCLDAAKVVGAPQSTAAVAAPTAAGGAPCAAFVAFRDAQAAAFVAALAAHRGDAYVVDRVKSLLARVPARPAPFEALTAW